MATNRSKLPEGEDHLSPDIPVNPYSGQQLDLLEIQPDLEEFMEAGMDTYENFLENGGLLEDHQSTEYRTPKEKKPAALLPLASRNAGRKGDSKSSRHLSSMVTSFEAALGFAGSNDPWKPAALPGIEKSSFGMRRSADQLSSLTPKPKSSSSGGILSPIKRPILPGIDRKPLPGICSSNRDLRAVQSAVASSSKLTVNTL